MSNPQRDANTPSQFMAAHLLAALQAGGVEHVFLAPGSRSQALAVAAGQLADAGKIKLHVRIDERSLGFLALGSAMVSGNPAVVITTSGTAVANLHPAVLEAHHSGVPMILLTADRPHELRGVGANQTTNQVGIFADAVRDCIDFEAPTADSPSAGEIVQLATLALNRSLGLDGSQPGPVQLNLAFREPLSDVEPNAAALNLQPQLAHRNRDTEFAMLDAATPTVVIAGAGAGPEATELAESFGWPLLAEPSSGARFGSNCIVSYRSILTERPELANQIGRVIVFGKPTLSRPVTRLFFNENIDVVVVRSETMGHFDVSRRASLFVDEVSVDNEVDFEWLRNWQIADNQIRLAAPVDGKLGRREIVETIWENTELDEHLLLGASRMIREADDWAPAKPIDVLSNRGLAGIDGTVGTATGIALTSGRKTRALLGDLTLLHDAGSLAIGSDTENLELQIIVVNDHGGTIFESLEMRQTLDDRTFEKLFRTPQNVNFAALAAAYGWLHIKVDSEAALTDAMQQSGRVLIEIVPAS